MSQALGWRYSAGRGPLCLGHETLPSQVINHKCIQGWLITLAFESLRILMRRSKEPQPALGGAMRQLRAERNLTQEALAHEAGITVGHLSMIERGLANPTWGTVGRIAEALDLSMVDVANAAERIGK